MTVATTETPRAELLPSELKVELWKRVDRRLRRGEVLITNEQFFKIMSRDFRRLLGVAPDRRVKVELLKMIMHVNETRPETYLTAGIKNAIDQFFKSAAGEGGAESREMIKRMVNEGRTALWLESMGIDIDPRMLSGRVERAIINIVEGKKLRPPPRRRERERRRRGPASEMVGVSQTTVEEAPPATDPPAYAPDPNEEEQQQRLAEDKKAREEIAGDEIRRAPRNLEAYLDQKLLSEEEAADLKTLYGIDKRLADGDIDEDEAHRLRSEISQVVRDKLQQRLREAADPAVQYINVFEALKRIPGDRDDAMRMLIRHRNQVVSEDDSVNLSVVTKTLEEDDELLDALGILMERKDHEMRMMAANMPPYRHIYTPGQSIGKFTVTEDFVGDLRELQRDDLSERLNSVDADDRLKAAADIKCMVALLSMLLNNTTAFHKEVRRLRIILRMRHLFDGSVDEKEGRNRVQQFLRRRLNSLYPDLSREERAAIDEAGQGIMDAHGSGDDDEEDKTKRVYRV